MSVEELDKALHTYAKASRLPLWRITFTDLSVDQAMTVRQLPYEEVLFRLGDFLAHTDRQRRVADVEAHLSASAARNPAYAPPVAARGEVALAAGDLATAVSLLRRAVAIDPRCERAQHLLGRAALSQAGSAAATSPSEASALLVESGLRSRRRLPLPPNVPRATPASASATCWLTLVPDEDVAPGIDALPSGLAANAVTPRAGKQPGGAPGARGAARRCGDDHRAEPGQGRRSEPRRPCPSRPAGGRRARGQRPHARRQTGRSRGGHGGRDRRHQ